MNRFQNGFYFFKELCPDRQGYRAAPDAARAFGCVSYFCSGGPAAMEITPERLELLPGAGFPVRCWIITEEASTLTRRFAGEIGRGKRRGLKITRQNRNTRPEYAAVCAVVLSAGELPVAAALAEESGLLPAALFLEKRPEEKTALGAEPARGAAPALPEQARKESTPPHTENSPARPFPQTRAEALLPETGVPFDPFRTTNPAYQWYAAPDPHRVRAFLAAFSVTLPLSLEKSAREAIAAYGHLLTGHYFDQKSGRSFLILGIPSACSRHSCPYNERYGAARWMPASVRYKKAGNAGYHLYYIDAGTSAIVKVIVHEPGSGRE